MNEIRWQAPEYEFHEKSKSWYYYSIGIVLAILAFAIWQKNYLFGFFIIAAEVLVLNWSNQKPRQIEFLINEKGLTIGGTKFYSYAELRSFGTTELDREESHFVEIIIYFRSHVKMAIIILLPKEESAKIQSALEKKIPKVEAELTMVDAIERYLRL